MSLRGEVGWGLVRARLAETTAVCRAATTPLLLVVVVVEGAGGFRRWCQECVTHCCLLLHTLLSPHLFSTRFSQECQSLTLPSP